MAVLPWCIVLKNFSAHNHPLLKSLVTRIFLSPSLPVNLVAKKIWWGLGKEKMTAPRTWLPLTTLDADQVSCELLGYGGATDTRKKPWNKIRTLPTSLIPSSHTVHPGHSTPPTQRRAACWKVPVEGGEQAAGWQHQRAPGQDRALVIDPVQVTTGHVGHANGTSRAVQKLVAIPERECVPFSPPYFG